MFVWGKADDGQLGLGGIEDTFIPVARSETEETCVCTMEPSLSPRPKTNPQNQPPAWIVFTRAHKNGRLE